MSEMTVIETAEMAREFDPELAGLILKRNALQEETKATPGRALHLVTRYVTDLCIPGAYQTEEYADEVIGRANPDMSAKEREARVAVRMACGELFREDSSAVVLTERVLDQRVSGAAESLQILSDLRQASLLPGAKLNVDVRVISMSGFASGGRGKLAGLAGGQLIVGGKQWYYTEPNTLAVPTLREAVFLANAAWPAAYSAEQSKELIEQRIERGDNPGHI